MKKTVWLFDNTPFSCQIYFNTKKDWDFCFDFKGTYYDESAYKKFFSFGKFMICWCLPTEEEVEKVRKENQKMFDNAIEV